MTFPRFLWPAGIAMVLAAQQGLPPGEIRLSSSEYWPRSQYTLRVEASLVEVGVVVRDSRGHSVGGFSRDDFEIEDSGKKRPITAFAVETYTRATAAPAAMKPTEPAAAPAAAPHPPQKPPRFVGLFFDDFSIGAADLPQAKAAARRFLKEGVESGDRVAIFSMSKPLVQPFTTDLARLNDAIDGLMISSRGPGGDSCPVFTSYDAYQVANRQDQAAVEIKTQEAFRCGACALPLRGRAPSAADLRKCEENIVVPMAQTVWEQVRDNSLRTLSNVGGIVDYMAGLPGKRVLLMVSSGFLANTLERQQDELASRALHAEVVINTLDAKGLFTNDFIETTRGADARSLTRMQMLGTTAKSIGNNPLSFLSASTGGLFFHNNNDLDLGFRELGLIPEHAYSLGFAPDNPPDTRFHQLKVRLLKGGSYTVQARPGYYAATAAPDAASAAQRRVDKEILSTAALDEAPARITAVPARTADGGPALRVAVYLDIARLAFGRQGGVRSQRITFIAALFDEQSNFVTGKEGEADFALQESTFKQLRGGWEGGLTLSAPPGKYRLRAVVQEAVGGKLTATTLPVTLD